MEVSTVSELVLAFRFTQCNECQRCPAISVPLATKLKCLPMADSSVFCSLSSRFIRSADCTALFEALSTLQLCVGLAASPLTWALWQNEVPPALCISARVRGTVSSYLGIR